jgi:NAD-dependent deacetylase sirtuin 2
MDPAGGLKRQRSISDEANAQSPGAAAYTADAQPAAPSLATAAPLTPRDPPPEREDSDSSDDGPSKLELLARQLDALRQAGELPDHLVDPPTPPPILSSFDADGLAAYINDGSERDIVVMGGAGMSTAAGIPDFRSPGTGLYDNLQKYDLPHPQAIFELAYFRERPEAFYALAKELWPGAYCPTTTHLFIKLLHDKGRLLRCFTQNIDSLESAAGVPAELTVAAHGNFDSATCIDTGASVDPNELKAAIDAGPQGWQALRDREGGLVKPDIVFFGEGLPRRFFELATQDLPRCKLLLVIGTSLSVQPFAQLVGHVPENCVRCLVNRDAVGRRDPRIPIAVARHLGSGSLDYGNAANYRDVALLGACDDGIRSLAASLGWADDLDRLVASATALFAARAPPPPPELPPPRQLSASELASIGDLLVDDDENAAPVVFE